MSKCIAALAAAMAIALAACGTQAVDYPLSGSPNTERRHVETTRDGAFVILAFSGGGSRAAALAAAVTAQLDSVTYNTPSGMRRLTEDIAVVSSVSGGSVYATYMALNGPSERKSREFRNTIQNFNGINYLAGRFTNPVTWIGLQFENTTRVAILQDMLDKILDTKNAKLSVLNRPGPVFLLNAGDMVAGHVFTFDVATLDDLCMNYDNIPLITATTASAAFPVAFTPVLLHNSSYADPMNPGCKTMQLPAVNFRNTLRDPIGSYANLERYRYIRYRDSLRGGMDSFRQPYYVRLVDGGVVDNLGLTSVRMGLRDVRSPFVLQRFISENSIRRLVVISVNARSDKENELDKSPQYTSILDTLKAVPGVLVDSASAGAASTFDGFVLNLAKDRDEIATEDPGARFEIYPIAIDFDQLPSATDQDRAFQKAVKSIDTSWTLKPDDVQKLDTAAELLLWRHPCFRDLLASLKASSHPSIKPVDAVCPAPKLPPPRPPGP